MSPFTLIGRRANDRYFGHGGGEQYIRGSKVRTLPKCATTFLWGCSSGKLDDQGDLDPAGTAWDYMMAGWYVPSFPYSNHKLNNSPALTATLWDVTDRDIDRYTTSVYRLLGLDPAHVLQQEKPRAEHSKMGLLPLSNQGMGLSTVEAVNLSREECKMTYLTGAAVVHYGIPVYIY
jgi:separase